MYFCLLVKCSFLNLKWNKWFYILIEFICIAENTYLPIRVLVAQSCLTLCNRWAAAHQALLSMGFSRQGYRNGLPFPSPGNLPDPGIKPGSPALQVGSLPTELLNARFILESSKVTEEVSEKASQLWRSTTSFYYLPAEFQAYKYTL